MKKITLTLATLMCLAMTLNAQSFFTDIVGCYSFYTPGAFSISGSPLLMTSYWDGEQDYYSFYDKNFELVCSFPVEMGFNGYYVEDFSRLRYTDLDNMVSGVDILFTQSLFNDDEYFEYMTYGEDEDYPYTSISIKSSNGSVIQTIRADEGFVLSDASECCMIRIDNKLYLLFNEYQESVAASAKTLVYQINQSEGLAKVDVELPISVFPSIANHNQQITVELGEGNNATEVTVINGLGQVVKRMPVQKGQRQVIIPAQDLNSGLNVVNTRTQQGHGSCKIIVR